LEQALAYREKLMCGRVLQPSDHSEIKIQPDFGTDFAEPKVDARWNKPRATPKLSVNGPNDARPGQELQVWRRHPETGEPIEGQLRWGLIPHWMKTRPKFQPINARAETITEKRMFCDAYAKRRCIVPMQVFYERDHSRRLHAFGMEDGEPFGVAGVWENWRNPEGHWERTFCIITVAANKLVSAVHDRMPAIVPIEHHHRWLGTESDPRDLLRPYPAKLTKEIPLR
jgi:putative SOS response-associated peptidase YedK